MEKLLKDEIKIIFPRIKVREKPMIIACKLKKQPIYNISLDRNLSTPTKAFWISSVKLQSLTPSQNLAMPSSSFGRDF
jgi:hypothetical protein